MARGRFAPTPSGDLHLGNLRTALVAWLFARGSGSEFVLRVEDLDPDTTTTGFAVRQLQQLRAIGIDWDGEVVHQSQRRPRHQAALAELERRDLVYPCYCTRREIRQAVRAPHSRPGYPGTCRNLDTAARRRLESEGRRPALRLRSTGLPIRFEDELAGSVGAPVDDVVVRRNDGIVAYNLAVVVDDADQGVEMVVRGDDLIAATPAQIVLAGALAITPPRYAHVPLALGPGGARLAKRDGAVTLSGLAAGGYDPAAVRALLAWSLGLSERGEPVTMDDLIDRFDPAAIPRDPWTVEADILAPSEPTASDG